MRCTSSCTSRTVRAELGRQALRACAASASRSFLSNSSPSLFRTRTSLIRTLSSFCRAFCCASSARDRDARRRIGHFLFRSPVKDSVAEHRSDDFCITERVNSAEWEVNELTSCTIEFVALAMWECAVPRGQVGHFGNGRKRDFDGRGNDANIVVSKHCVLRLSFHWAIWIESEWVQFLPSHG